MKRIPLLALLIVCPLLVRCSPDILGKFYDEIPVEASKIPARDIRVFQKTRSWSLAKAIRDGDTSAIRSMLGNDMSLMSVRDPAYESTLLMHAVWENQIDAFRLLLDLGADITPCLNLNGYHVAAIAAKESHGSPFLEYLLKKGFNPDTKTCPSEGVAGFIEETPLTIAAFWGRRDNVRLLIAAGADVNWVGPFNICALNNAIDGANFASALDLLEAGASPTISFTFYGSDVPEEKDILYALRASIQKIGSEAYRDKMRVVEWLKKRGLDYRSSPIPDYIEGRLHQLYPDSVQYYLEHY